MRYEEMTKGKRALYTTIAWILLVVTLGAVWYTNFVTPFGKGAEIALKVFQNELVADCVNTVMLLLTALLITGISETMTRLKRHASERVMCMALVMGALLALDSSLKTSFIEEAGVYNYLYAMVVVLIFMWAYLREIPYDCFGSKEPWLFVTIWIIPVGLLAGFANRSVGIVLFIFAIVTITYVNKVEHRVFAWMPIGAVCVFLGFVARMLLPAYLDRNILSALTVYGETSELPNYGIWAVKEVFVSLVPTLLVTLSVAALLKGVHNVALGREIAYVLATACGTWILTILIPGNGGTAIYQVVVLLLLACAAMCLKLFEKRPAMKVYIYIGCGFLWLRAAWLICESLFL
ncbi:hypothetical protein SAMN02910339_00441 [Lachnospiraceae bacterium YSD2013]|nr:hypothetical protein SAMN02910339_00441 [Lachnospiraceae bacterium YSD2013]